MSFPRRALTIEAGTRPRERCPIVVNVPDGLPDQVWGVCPNDGSGIWLQRIGPEEYAALTPSLEAGERKQFIFDPRTVGPDGPQLLTVAHERGAGIDLLEAGELVTRYIYGGVPARPYFYPLKGPAGVALTRSYPMLSDGDGETRDHRHHRSLSIAHGDVNGVDNWSEEPGHGYTTHRSVEALITGNVVARMTTRSDWTDAAGTPLLDQRLEVLLWASTPTIRTLDIAVRLTAAYGAVKFGDTKEGGIVLLRMASALDVPRGGRITNVYGGVNEEETWGKSSHWVDYSGTIDGGPAGIAVMDHPLSFRYPTHWHVRNYGLMTANPFGYSHFTNGAKRGDHVLNNGESIEFRYRLLLHRGCDRETVDLKYLDFVSPPSVAFAGA